MKNRKIKQLMEDLLAPPEEGELQPGESYLFYSAKAHAHGIAPVIYKDRQGNEVEITVVAPNRDYADGWGDQEYRGIGTFLRTTAPVGERETFEREMIQDFNPPWRFGKSIPPGTLPGTDT